LASNITYQPFGDITSMTYGNGLVTTKTYNNRYQLNGLNIGNLKQLTYTRDNAGNITAITDTLNPSTNKSYTYDNLYRLTLANGQWGTITYAYNPVGNRTYETTNTGNTTYAYNANKLASVSGEKTFSFNYDSNGNTTGENTKQYIYSQNQRLTQVTDTGTVLGEYVYNAKGQRVKKTVNGQTTVFHYDQNGLMISESLSTGNITAEYVYLNGQPLAKIENNNIFYYHVDHLGTPMEMTDSTGSIVWQGEFKPFGGPLSVTGSITNNLRFSGQYYDSETGLHQNWHRDYKPEVGRYVESDPILQPMISKPIKSSCSKSTVTWRVPMLMRNPQDLLPYVYTKGNPIILTDPTGLVCGSGWNDWFVPDKFPLYNFTGCCQTHDDCYGCKGKAQGLSKATCDQNFCTCLLEECEHLDGDSKRSCEGNAKTFCNVVQGRFGNDAFNKARKCCNRGSSGSW
jgi:RHS repeat-associated protein